MAVWAEGRGLARTLGGEVEDAVEGDRGSPHDIGQEQGYTNEIGGEGGMVVGNSYVGGSEGVVKAKREEERTVQGRLI